MRITCGTDFSDRGREAADVAALLAARSGGRLSLVHALDTRGAVLGAAHVLEALETAAREQLDYEAARLQALGAEVEVAMPDGWPDEAVLGEAQRQESSLIVLAATGSRDGPGVSVGKTCERSLARTSTPMLVVRDAPPLTAWLRGDKPLRIMVAFDFSPEAAAALAFAARFARLGNCRIVVAHVDDPQREARRLGLSGSCWPTGSPSSILPCPPMSWYRRTSVTRALDSPTWPSARTPIWSFRARTSAAPSSACSPARYRCNCCAMRRATCSSCRPPRPRSPRPRLRRTRCAACSPPPTSRTAATGQSPTRSRSPPTAPRCTSCTS
jgi:nucleotide-binding universal stress UspA family protein